jgi:hypothetical protein
LDGKDGGEGKNLREIAPPEIIIFKYRFFIGKNTASLLMILQKMSRSNKEPYFLKKSGRKICRFGILCLKLAPSSFCVYLFGLESLAAIG